MEAYREIDQLRSSFIALSDEGKFIGNVQKLIHLLINETFYA